MYHTLNMIQSSVGLGGHLASTYLDISGTIVPPLNHVKKKCCEGQDDNISVSAWLSIRQVMEEEFMLTVGYFVCYGLMFGTLLASYELWVNVFGDPDSILSTVPALVFSITPHTISMTIALVILQAIALVFSENSSKPWSVTLYVLLHSLLYIYQNYSFLFLALGSQVYRCSLMML